MPVSAQIIEDGPVAYMRNTAHRLRHADWILVLGAEGATMQQGAYDDLVAKNGYVRSLSETLGINDSTLHEAEGQSAVPDVKPAYATNPRQDAIVADNSNSRQATDSAIYAHYFKSIGSTHSALFILGAVVFAVLLKIPGWDRAIPPLP